MSIPEGERVSPRWLLAVMSGALYIFLSSTFFSIAVNSLSLGLMAICWVALMMVSRRWDVAATPLDYFFLAYAFAEIISTLFSRNMPQALFFSRRVLLIGIVYFLASRLTTESLIRRSVAVLLGTASVVALIGVAKLLVAKPEDVIRLGIFQFYMTTSELMMIAALFLFPFVIHPETPLRVRLAALAGIVPVLVTLYATVTRGAYLAFGAGVLLIALVRNKKLIIPLAILILLMIFFAPPYVESRLKSIVDMQHPENVSRLMMWRAGLKIFAEHPIVGVGDIDLGVLMKEHAEPGYPDLWGHLHNVGLQFLATLGIIGFTAVIAMFVMMAVTEWRIYAKNRGDWFRGSLTLGALAVFAGFQVNGLTEWTFGDQEVVILLWISLGFALAVGRLGGNEPSPSGVKENGGRER